ncbi:hypothetical protein C0995_009110 [Termitomyces sp. Mi166|nr:hypothetical protein C0995_009110 [Termitomyces sp. Mi166\
MSKLDVVDFPNNGPAQAGPAQLLFMCTVSILAPPPQPQNARAVRWVGSEPTENCGRIQEQGKSGGHNESNYGQSSSEEEQELEEEESAAQRFQRMQ